MIEIREERPSDVAAIRDVNRRAFGQDLEGNLVDLLRSNEAILVSLVAVQANRIVGHILYSPVSIGGLEGAGLGPMAVLPELQRQGIGARLVETGNRMLRDAGCPFVVVVGHPEYYPRFGFEPARPHGIQCQWDVPDDVFLALVFDRAKMQGVTGLAKYRDEFSTVG